MNDDAIVFLVLLCVMTYFGRWVFVSINKHLDRKGMTDDQARLEELLNSLNGRIGEIESRLNNLETIVVEREKSSKFDSLID